MMNNEEDTNLTRGSKYGLLREDLWKMVMEGGESERKGSGILLIEVERGIENKNEKISPALKRKRLIIWL